MKPVIYGSIAAVLTGVRRIVNALAGLGYVFTSTQTRAHVLRPALELALGRVLRLRRGHVIVQNADDAKVLDVLGVGSRQISTIAGSGVDTAGFAPSPEPDGPIVVCMVSRMLWDKGVGELVAAARSLREHLPTLRVWLVGPRDEENPACIPESELRAWSEEGVVEWLGKRDDIAAIWQRAHIAVLPSYREGLPKSLVEAAACARPLVACDVPGSREVVIDGETGLLVPARDAGALAEAIRRLAEDAEFRQRLGRSARRRVLEHFAEGRIVSETLALYRELLAS